MIFFPEVYRNSEKKTEENEIPFRLFLLAAAAV
jgi:hypothetical protein